MSFIKQISALSVSNVTVTYDSKNIILDDVSVEVPQSVMMAIIGPNGAGKSTFLKAVLGLIKSENGNVLVLNENVKKQAKRIAYIPQKSTVDWDFPTYVLDVVLMGRYVHLGWFKRPRDIDYDCAWQALEQVGLTNYAYHPIGQLSGGQQQRVFFARALAQEADVYFLDEPFVGVDMQTELALVTLLQSLRSRGKTICAVHHDLQTLSSYFDYALLLNRKVVAYGPIEQIVQGEYFSAHYTRFSHKVQRGL